MKKYRLKDIEIVKVNKKILEDGGGDPPTYKRYNKSKKPITEVPTEGMIYVTSKNDPLYKEYAERRKLYKTSERNFTKAYIDSVEEEIKESIEYLNDAKNSGDDEEIKFWEEYIQSYKDLKNNYDYDKLAAETPINENYLKFFEEQEGEYGYMFDYGKGIEPVLEPNIGDKKLKKGKKKYFDNLKYKPTAVGDISPGMFDVTLLYEKPKLRVTYRDPSEFETIEDIPVEDTPKLNTTTESPSTPKKPTIPKNSHLVLGWRGADGKYYGNYWLTPDGEKIPEGLTKEDYQKKRAKTLKSGNNNFQDGGEKGKESLRSLLSNVTSNVVDESDRLNFERTGKPVTQRVSTEELLASSKGMSVDEYRREQLLTDSKQRENTPTKDVYKDRPWYGTGMTADEYYAEMKNSGVKDVTEAMLPYYELTGLPAAYRVGSDPIGTVKGVGNTIMDLGAMGDYRTMIPALATGKNPVTGNEMWSGLDKTLDATVLAPAIGAVGRGIGAVSRGTRGTQGLNTLLKSGKARNQFLQKAKTFDEGLPYPTSSSDDYVDLWRVQSKDFTERLPSEALMEHFDKHTKSIRTLQRDRILSKVGLKPKDNYRGKIELSKGFQKKLINEPTSSTKAYYGNWWGDNPKYLIDNYVNNTHGGFGRIPQGNSELLRLRVPKSEYDKFRVQNLKKTDKHSMLDYHSSAPEFEFVTPPSWKQYAEKVDIDDFLSNIPSKTSAKLKKVDDYHKAGKISEIERYKLEKKYIDEALQAPDMTDIRGIAPTNPTFKKLETLEQTTDVNPNTGALDYHWDMSAGEGILNVEEALNRRKAFWNTDEGTKRLTEITL